MALFLVFRCNPSPRANRTHNRLTARMYVHVLNGHLLLPLPRWRFRGLCDSCNSCDTWMVRSERLPRKSAPMDLSGRFNFWRVLILTRAITPPRAVGGLWSRFVDSERGGWWLLLIVAVVTVSGAAAVHLSQPATPLQSQAIGPFPTVASSPSPARAGPRW
jgi:hypothetical protein